MFDTPKHKFEMRGQLTPENAALVLVDYQVGTGQRVDQVTRRRSANDATGILGDQK